MRTGIKTLFYKLLHLWPAEVETVWQIIDHSVKILFLGLYVIGIQRKIFIIICGGIEETCHLDNT